MWIDYPKFPTTGISTDNIDWTKQWTSPGTWQHPYYVGTTTITGTPMNVYEIRKVSNGFVLKYNNEEFAFESIANLLSYLSTELEKK